MTIRLSPFLLLLALMPLCLHAQVVVHPLSYGADGFHDNNWYSNYVGVRFNVLTPASVAGEKHYTSAHEGTAGWGGASTPMVNKQIVMPQAGDSLATAPITVSMAGKIALVYRGINEYVCKAVAAQAAGAIACVIVNNIPGPPLGMGAGSICSGVTIPVYMISKSDGDALDALYCSGIIPTVTITPWGLNNANDLGFVPEGTAGWSNYATPANQLNAGSPRLALKALDGGFIANYGTHKATNVHISDTLFYTPAGGSTSSVHTGITPNLSTFLVSDSIYTMFGAEYNFPATPAGNGRFDIKYTISSDSLDQYIGDNTATYSFYKTDSVYSKGKYDFTTNTPQVGNFISFGGFNPFMWGPMYYVAHGGTAISSVQFAISSNTPGPLPVPDIQVHIFKWQDGSGGSPLDSFMQNGELTEVSMGHYTVLPTDTSGSILKVRMGSLFGTPEAVVLDSASWYYVAVNVPTGFFLGVEGDCSAYPRIYGRSHVSNYIDYANVLFPDDYSSLPLVSGSGEYPTAFPKTFFINSIDSFNYGELKGLIPAVSLIVNNDPFSLVYGPPSLCVGDAAVFSDPVSGGTWTSSSVSVATIDATAGNVVAIAPGTTVITYHSGALFATAILTVDAPPDAGTISGPTAVCSGSTVTLTESVPGGSWGTFFTSGAATVSATGVVTGVSVGLETITYTVTNTCSTASAMHNVTVGPTMTTGSLSGPSAVCVGSSITLTDPVPGGAWSAATGKASVVGGVVTGITGGLETISYTFTSTCGTAAATASVMVNPLPVPVITASGTALSVAGSYSSYQWLFAGGPIGGATTATYNATLNGAYAVTVTDANGCTATSGLTLVSTAGVKNIDLAAGEITINPNPTSGAFTIQASVAGTCTILTAAGQQVRQYNATAGKTTFQLPGSIAAGVYICRFDGVDGSKMVVRLVYEPK